VAKVKARTEAHLIDEAGQQLLRSALPKEWVIHEYRPDYGVDYSVELFSPTSLQPAGGRVAFETLGEHVFVQLKSTRCAKTQTKRVPSRLNVELTTSEVLDTRNVVDLPVVKCQIEASELATVQRMGSALPVILVVADLASNCCYFVCLNDYIDKVLIPKYKDEAVSKSRTIEIPTTNRLGDHVVGHTAIRWYGKRAKLYAAFQKIVFQQGEISHIPSSSEQFLSVVKHFGRLLLHYDIWDSTEMWAIVGDYGQALKRLLRTGQTVTPGLNFHQLVAARIRADAARAGESVDDGELADYIRELELRDLWQRLAVLPRNYEDICREWFLPTSLGLSSSYPPPPASCPAPG
jgi:hypothetical protein